MKDNNLSGERMTKDEKPDPKVLELDKVRRKYKLPVQTIVRFLGTHQGSWYRWVNGEVAPSPAFKQKILKLLQAFEDIKARVKEMENE